MGIIRLYEAAHSPSLRRCHPCLGTVIRIQGSETLRGFDQCASEGELLSWELRVGPPPEETLEPHPI